MKMALRVLIITLFIMKGLAFAESIPEVGKTYQIDRAKYPGKVAICVTESSMTTYMEAIWDKDEARASKLLHQIKNQNDIEKLQVSGGCTLISSFSQAKIIQKGLESHQAEFSAFPFLPMWGYYLYFGAIAP